METPRVWDLFSFFRLYIPILTYERKTVIAGISICPFSLSLGIFNVINSLMFTNSISLYSHTITKPDDKKLAEKVFIFRQPQRALISTCETKWQ